MRVHRTSALLYAAPLPCTETSVGGGGGGTRGAPPPPPPTALTGEKDAGGELRRETLPERRASGRVPPPLLPP